MTMTSDEFVYDAAVDESTTLVTFLLCASPDIHSIDLLGSWDNFSRPYSMVKDSRRSGRHWKGIHRFKDIICDGDPSNVTAKRNGGLRTGGLYWYYYRLNDDTEFHNPAEPSTTTCPLLPGQKVNVLEVPHDLSTLHSSHRERSALASVTTLNPDDRWAPLNGKGVKQPATSSNARQVSHKRRLYLDQAFGRQATATAEACILAANGHDPPIVPVEDAASSLKRSKSLSAKGSSEGRLRGALWRFLTNECHPGYFEDSDDLQQKHGDSRNRMLPTSKSPTPPARGVNVDLPKASRLAFARPRNHPRTSTANAALSSCKETTNLPALTPFNISSADAMAVKPGSAPSTFRFSTPAVSSNRPPTLGCNEYHNDEKRSLMTGNSSRNINIEQTGGASEHLRTLTGFTESFSGEMAEYLASTSDNQHFWLNSEPKTPLEGQGCHSPLQLSPDSRESILWTPDTGSVRTDSEFWERSQRSSFRYSLQSAVTVYNDESDDAEPLPKEQDGGDEVLGIGVSGLGLVSQETIKPARTVPLEPEPLDISWNPFSKTVASDETTISEHDEKLAQEADSTADMMNDLTFLGAAIVQN